MLRWRVAIVASLSLLISSWIPSTSCCSCSSAAKRPCFSIPMIYLLMIRSTHTSQLTRRPIAAVLVVSSRVGLRGRHRASLLADIISILRIAKQGLVRVHSRIVHTLRRRSTTRSPAEQVTLSGIFIKSTVATSPGARTRLVSVAISAISILAAVLVVGKAATLGARDGRAVVRWWGGARGGGGRAESWIGWDTNRLALSQVIPGLLVRRQRVGKWSRAIGVRVRIGVLLLPTEKTHLELFSRAVNV